MAHVLSPAMSSPLATSQPPSPLSSPSKATRRIPRTRSRPHMSSRASLESITEEAPGDSLESSPTRTSVDSAPGPTHDQGHTRATRPQEWNGKNGIPLGRGMRDVCGICFESAVKPNKARCCGQMFCYQHLSDWLSATGSDGRCPTCRVPLSLETDTICLHPPAKLKLPAVTFAPALRPSKRRSPTSSWSRRSPYALIQPRYSSSGSSSSSSQEYDSDAGSSSTSEGESIGVLRRVRASSIQPKYESVTELMSDLVPLREFGSLLSLVGCALVIGTLLS